MWKAGGATMHTIGTSCRRGTSTIMGTLIFIGILFTAVIPMYLFMRQADTFYEIRKFELGRLDEEKRREDIRVHVFPTPESPPDQPHLTVRVDNRGELLVRVVRVWVNDQSWPVDCAVQGMSQEDLDPLAVEAGPDDTFAIKVTTDRGNEFASDSGIITYLGNGEWEVGMLVINVLIYYAPGGVYDIDIWLGEEIGDPKYSKTIQKSSGTAFTFVDVTENGAPNTYHVKITRGSDIIYNHQVTINWPSGPPVVWVFA